MANQELLTAGKLAKEFDVPQKIIKNIIQEMNIEADVIKGNCKYYTRETANKIKSKISAK